jgi:hypothetical protein
MDWRPVWDHEKAATQREKQGLTDQFPFYRTHANYTVKTARF